MSLPGLSEFAVVAVIISQFSSQDLILVVGHRVSGGSPFLVSCWHGGTYFTGCTLPMEDTMSWANSCTHSGPHSGGLGSLLSRNTSLYSSQISSQEVLYPTSWMAGTSTLVSSLGVLASGLSKLLAPSPSALTLQHVENNLWRMKRQWGPPAFH